MAELVVVGSYNAGLSVHSAQLPAPGETVVGGRFENGPGGKGANQAIGARRLGTDVLFVTRLGADAFGATARTVLLAEGLPERGITTDDRSPTGVALILVDEAGQNAISVAPLRRSNRSWARATAAYSPRCPSPGLARECSSGPISGS